MICSSLAHLHLSKTCCKNPRVLYDVCTATTQCMNTISPCYVCLDIKEEDGKSIYICLSLLMHSAHTKYDSPVWECAYCIYIGMVRDSMKYSGYARPIRELMFNTSFAANLYHLSTKVIIFIVSLISIVILVSFTWFQFSHCLSFFRIQFFFFVLLLIKKTSMERVMLHFNTHLILFV